jgi:Trk K+ transport system NAD-binding subunit
VTLTENPEASTTTMELPASGGQPPFIVCGDNPLAVRLAEMLTTQYDREVVAIVRPGANRWTARIQELPGVRVVTAEVLNRMAFVAAELEQADAIALVDQDDAANVEAALLAQEINPDLRIVLRMAKQSLGERISALLRNCVVLSASAIAAPAFVAAAVGRAATPPIEVGGRTVVGILRERTRAEDVLAGLAVMGPRGSVPEVLPADADERADLVLARSKPAPPPRPPRTSPASLVFSLLFGRRMRAVIAVFLVLYALGTAALSLALGTSWGDAAYGALITALSGNPEIEARNVAAQVAIVGLTVVSLGLIPALTATVVDALVKLRLQREAGGLYDHIEDHTVVVGLGDVGTRIIRALHDQGVEVVAIERNPQAPGVQIARDLKIPVIIGDASRPETLDRASISTAQALVVASTDDVTNLETALLGLAARAELRVVLRLFDSEFADRVRRSFNIHTSRSVSYLAAPAFAAAMLGRTVLATIPVRRRVTLVAEIPVGERSLLEHRTVASVNRPHEARLLAVRTADQVVWRPAEGRPIRAGDRIIVVATRAGLSRLLAESDTGSDAGPPAPYGLLAPWELPHSRPGTRAVPPPSGGPESAEGAGAVPPIGPADGGSTRPA